MFYRETSAEAAEFSSEQLLTELRQAVTPGLEQLDEATLDSLRDITGRLVQVHGTAARADYLRYLDTENRELEVPDDLLREQLTGKTILVTGGTGLIGSQLMQQLRQYEPGRLVSVSRGHKQPFIDVPGAEYHTADIRNEAAINELFSEVKPDIVYHLAAEKHPAIAEVEPQRTLTTNIFGTENVLKAAETNGTKQFVYASTGKASRPFSPDTYAASKKVAEALVGDAADRGEMVCSGVRFTHVVDGSNIITRIRGWIDADEDVNTPTEPIRLHDDQTLFYVQSARESARLMLLSGLDAKPGTFNLNAIRMLDLPINLGNLAIGALAERGATTPIYVSGHDQGYEAHPYPFLFDPMFSGDVSPLVNGLEAPQVQPSAHNPAVDVFPFMIDRNSEVDDAFVQLRETCDDPEAPLERLHSDKDALSWVLLAARLRRLPQESLARTAKRIERHSLRAAQSDDTPYAHAEHELTSKAILEVHASYSA